MKPIYKPKGAAGEYCEWALNIYTGCPHRCYYCYCPKILHRDMEEFFSHVEPRKNIVEETRKQIERDDITGRLIHLCFIGDAYPTGYDTSATREIIKLLKEAGNHVQILTKGDGRRDFDLLDDKDWYGVTISGGLCSSASSEPRAIDPHSRVDILEVAKGNGIKTWVSFEPVIDPDAVLDCIKICGGIIDKVKIGKLNYYPSNINWAQFGMDAESLCKEIGIDYYIKDGLRKEMERNE